MFKTAKLAHVTKETKPKKHVTREIPQGPWQVVGVDLFHYANRDYLLAVDYYSKYVEIACLKDTSSNTVILHLKSIFARLGIPYLIYSDNGPQFQSSYFRDFAQKWGFEHKTSSPRFPQSNGLAERFVGTIKQMLKKCEFDKKDMHLALLEFRNTPISDKIPSPTELMFGRKMRGILPVQQKYNQKEEQVRQLLDERRNVQMKYYNKSTKDLKPLKVNDQVLVKKEGHNILQPAKVVNSCDRPRSYALELSDGSVLERNRRHIHVAPNTQKPLTRFWETEDTQSSQPNNRIPNKDNTSAVISNEPLEQTVSTSSLNETTSVQDDKSSIPRTTRSSRIVKPPTYLKDYITY